MKQIERARGRAVVWHCGGGAVRVLFLLMLLWMGACERPGAKVGGSSPDVAPSESPAVVALAHFREASGSLLPKSTMAKRILMVDGEYISAKEMVSMASFDLVLSSENFSVPEDLRLDLEGRTGVEETVAEAEGRPFLRIVDGEKDPVPQDEAEFLRRYPDAKAGIALWPTGVSRSGKHALVTFLYGVPYAAWRAVYLLERRGKVWEIVHFAFPASG